jgi:hypothetical protein
MAGAGRAGLRVGVRRECAVGGCGSRREGLGVEFGDGVVADFDAGGVLVMAFSWRFVKNGRSLEYLVIALQFFLGGKRASVLALEGVWR